MSPYSDKPKEKTRIVVAMSGGVDSSAAAAILKKEGYEVIGITLRLYDSGDFSAKKGACCAGADIYDAKTAADKISIPHYVLDYESKFRDSVIEDFVGGYLSGETPLPCVKCNQSVKFDDLLKASKNLGADFMATGHYVRKIKGENGFELHKGMDPKKDQSYFLFATTKEQLDYLLFPVGSMTKGETRERAREAGLTLADKPDSQDICFVSGDYKDFIKKYRPDSAREGKIMHIGGYELGRHEGIIGYTVGQRRGLGLSSDEPLYVVKIDPENNVIYVGGEENLYKKELYVKNVNWLGEEFEGKKEVSVKIRSLRPAVTAFIEKKKENNFRVEFLSPEKAVAPGQACVMYEGDRLLGGGWISGEGIYG